MSHGLAASARRLGCSERTLRRYVHDGLVRGHRVAGRRLELSSAEQDYLTCQWKLLNSLRMALRTERAVRLAVLFGSTAVGEDDQSSDVDLLVVHRNPTPSALAGVQLRLGRAVDRAVDVVGLEQAEAMPTLLMDVLREGRVLIDRDGLWEGLCRRRDEVFAAAEREERRTATQAWAAVAAARERVRVAASA